MSIDDQTEIFEKYKNELKCPTPECSEPKPTRFVRSLTNDVIRAQCLACKKTETWNKLLDKLANVKRRMEAQELEGEPRNGAERLDENGQAKETLDEQDEAHVDVDNRGITKERQEAMEKLNELLDKLLVRTEFMDKKVKEVRKQNQKLRVTIGDLPGNGQKMQAKPNELRAALRVQPRRREDSERQGVGNKRTANTQQGPSDGQTARTISVRKLPNLTEQATSQAIPISEEHPQLPRKSRRS